MANYHTNDAKLKEDEGVKNFDLIMTNLINHTMKTFGHLTNITEIYDDSLINKLDISDVLITVFSNLIANILAKGLLSMEQYDLGLHTKMFKYVNDRIYKKSEEIFHHVILVNSKKEGKPND
jgi:hypothetical protein